MNWTPETPVKRSPKAVWRSFGGEVAIIVPGTTAVRTLNQVGARVWELADGRTLAAILDQVLRQIRNWAHPTRIGRARFLNELETRHLLEVQASPP